MQHYMRARLQLGIGKNSQTGGNHRVAAICSLEPMHIANYRNVLSQSLQINDMLRHAVEGAFFVRCNLNLRFVWQPVSARFYTMVF